MARNEQLSIRNQLGYATSGTFDAKGRQTLRQYADARRVTFARDQVGNTTMMSDSTRMTTYAFDSVNRMSGKTDPGSLSQGYSYDVAGQSTKLVDPDGGTRTFTFDSNSRMSSLVLPNGTGMT